MPGQTYQRQDAIGMFLQSPGLIVRILPKQMPGLRTLPNYKFFPFPFGSADVCSLVLASKAVSPGTCLAPKETSLSHPNST